MEMELQPNPFKLFPFEIWEQILETCENSQTIQNVLTAYPLLEGVFMQNKPRWMMGMVMPFIRSRLEDSDMLSCRRVCRRWSKAVDNYMETHPHLYTLKVNLINRSSPFYRDMEECPRGRNPFLGRVTELDFGDGEMPMRHREPEDVPELFPGEFWLKTLSALQTFGGHLRSVWISSKRPEQQHFYQRFITTLALLPNLRSLHLDVKHDPVLEPGIPLEYVEALPPLPRLHTLWFDNLRPVTLPLLTHVLVLGYSAQIKYLRIRSSNWREEYSTLFPRLVCLILDGIGSHKEAADLLGSLQAPKLFRLHLDLSYDIDGSVVSLLKGFEHIEKVHLVLSSPEDGRCKKVPPNSIHGDTIPSLRSLSITGFIPAKMNFDFLQSFPSLEYFRIEHSFHKLRYFKADGVHKLDLWEKLPKLREIVVLSFISKPIKIVRVHGTRAQYDRVRQASSQQKRQKKCAIL